MQRPPLLNVFFRPTFIQVSLVIYFFVFDSQMPTGWTMDFLVRGVIRSFLYMLKYQLDSHLAADPIMSSQQYLGLNNLYMSVLCFLDDDPMTSGYIDFVTPTQRGLMLEWRVLRMSTHTINPRTGVSTRNRQLGRLHVFSSEMQAEVQDTHEDHGELSPPLPVRFRMERI